MCGFFKGRHRALSVPLPAVGAEVLHGGSSSSTRGGGHCCAHSLLIRHFFSLLSLPYLLLFFLPLPHSGSTPSQQGRSYVGAYLGRGPPRIFPKTSIPLYLWPILSAHSSKPASLKQAGSLAAIQQEPNSRIVVQEDTACCFDCFIHFSRKTVVAS